MVRFAGMASSIHNFKGLFRWGLAAFLAVWLSGLAFLICCPNARAASSEAFCPLAKMGGHCERTRNRPGPSWTSEGSGDCGVTGCAYLPIVFDKSRKVEKTKKQPAPTGSVNPVNFAPPASVKVRFFPTISSARIAFDDRILARHCILRI